MNILLSDLLYNSGQFPQKILHNLPHIEISGVTHDSREVVRGNLFVALSGRSFDGHAFIQDAINKGAVAVIGEGRVPNSEVPYFQTGNTRLALAHLAASYYGFPSKQLTVIGVTGTDGKTTTVNLIYSILGTCGIKAGLISTVNVVIGDEKIDTGFHVTTPEAPNIQQLLRKVVDQGLTHVVIEATSHGLEQHRVSACDFDLGVVTNITHEHLDYHGDFNNYLNAKAMLLTGLVDTKDKKAGNYRMAIINRDDQSYEHLKRILVDERYQKIKIIEYGLDEQSDIQAQNIENTDNGLRFDLKWGNSQHEIRTSLIGEYNAHNILAAVSATAIGLGLDIQCVIEGVASLSGVSGRMERISLGQKFSAIVDFAHTPNALKVALETCRNRTDKRVIVVFGSAGLRDRQKRRIMAATSIAFADISILTAEDPRTESLNDILSEMADEAQKQGGIENETFYRIPDRGEAIRKAVEMADEDDLVIICGKGHEQSMCFGEIEFLWDDRTALRSALSSLLNIEGPEMPYLPTQDK